MDESDELSGLEGMLALTWVSLAVISCKKKTKKTLKVNEQTHQLDLTELFLKTIFKI